MGTPRHLTAALAALLTLGVVGGCTDDSPDKDGSSSSTKDGSRTTVEMTEVKGTEALRPKTTIISSWGTVVSGKRSTVVAELTGSDGKPSRLVAVDPKTRTQHSLDVTAPASWAEAANTTTAVVAGDVSQDHARKPFVRVSSDLKTWDDVPISYPDKGWSVSAAGLDGDVPLVIARKPDGGTVLMRREGDAWATHNIPAAKGQELSPIDLVEHRGRLVLLATEAPRGDESVTRVLTSADGGKTWERGPKMVGAKGSYGIAGAVSTGKAIVATGWSDRKAPQGTSGMVWTSRDSRSWSRKRTPSISWREDAAWGTSEDFHLSQPTLVGGRAAFDQTCGSCTWTTRFVHPGTGVAEVKDNQLSIRDSAPTSEVISGPSNAGVRWVDGSLVVFEGKSTRTLVDGEVRAQVSGIEEVGDSSNVTVSRYRFTGDPDGGWAATSHLTPFVLRGSLRRAAWSPKELESWSDVLTARSSDGTTVAAGTKEDDGFTAVARSLSKGSWRTSSGLGRAEHESVNGLTRAGDRFLMSLVVAADGGAGTTRRARVYSSKDGVAWSEDPGVWAPKRTTGSTISEICELGDGTPFGVGSSQASDNAPYAASTWTRSKGIWGLDVPDLDGHGASFESCATTGDTTVVSGRVGGDDVEWTTRDGKAFTAGKPLPRGVSRGTPHEVEGGLVAAGHLATAEHSGPVVWFSKDGKAWQWAAVETDDVSSSVSVMASGDDVYAVTSQSSGDRIWKIDEIATTKVTGDEG